MSCLNPTLFLHQPASEHRNNIMAEHWETTPTFYCTCQCESDRCFLSLVSRDALYFNTMEPHSIPAIMIPEGRPISTPCLGSKRLRLQERPSLL